MGYAKQQGDQIDLLALVKLNRKKVLNIFIHKKSGHDSLKMKMHYIILYLPIHENFNA